VSGLEEEDEEPTYASLIKEPLSTTYSIEKNG